MREIPEGTLAESLEDCKRCKNFRDNKCEIFKEEVKLEDRFSCGAVEVMVSSLEQYYNR